MVQVAAIAADTKGAMSSAGHSPLHLYLYDHGKILATRPRGREAADQIRNIADQPGDLILDFRGVEVASAPFLQEVVDAAHGIVLRAAKEAGRIVLFANMNEDVGETLRFVVAKRKLSLAYLDDGRIDLIEAKQHLVETLQKAQQLKSFTAPELAKELDIADDTATQRLRRLMETGAVVREPDPETSRGIRHLYRAATAELAGVES
jgi:DNA-binding MarR family transcriptional regulator